MCNYKIGLLNLYIPMLLFYFILLYYNTFYIFYPILTTAKMFREMLHISTVLRAFPFQHHVYIMMCYVKCTIKLNK